MAGSGMAARPKLEFTRPDRDQDAARHAVALFDGVEGTVIFGDELAAGRGLGVEVLLVEIGARAPELGLDLGLVRRGRGAGRGELGEVPVERDVAEGRIERLPRHARRLRLRPDLVGEPGLEGPLGRRTVHRGARSDRGDEDRDNGGDDPERRKVAKECTRRHTTSVDLGARLHVDDQLVHSAAAPSSRNERSEARRGFGKVIFRCRSARPTPSLYSPASAGITAGGCLLRPLLLRRHSRAGS